MILTELIHRTGIWSTNIHGRTMVWPMDVCASSSIQKTIGVTAGGTISIALFGLAEVD